MDVSGLTFSEVCDAVGPTQHHLPALRRSYRHALRGLPQEGPLTTSIAPVSGVQRDGDLVKFVQRHASGLETESVIIPMRGKHLEWRSLCVSSQVGCALGCTFCETAQLGLLANLTAGQIVGQYVAARREFQADIRNVVFMGMGEPLDNFENVVQAVRVLNDRCGCSIAMDRITISTVGRIAGIRRLASLGWRRLNLAVSLNAPNDEIRRQIMPIDRAEPMPELRAALLDYPLRNCQFFMIEYVLIPGLNDAHEHARELVEFVKPLKCCVNVIPYNPRRDSPWPAPSEESVSQFLGWIADAGQYCKRRITKGRDHMAACGQLGNRALSRRHGAAEPLPIVAR
ncbi:MAG: 23S rRNA (adenine(2503)-C(2))-methyltransferase RlmN [Phycisphaerae bacterium]